MGEGAFGQRQEASSLWSLQVQAISKWINAFPVIHPHYGPHPLYIQSFVPTPNQSHPFGPFFRKQWTRYYMTVATLPTNMVNIKTSLDKQQGSTERATINLLHTITPTLTLDRELYDHHRPLPQKLQCIIG